MPPPTPFSLTTPLPAADLRFESMSHSSGLSVLEEMQLNLLSEKPDINPDKLLGHTVDLTVLLRDAGAKRHFCGFVTRFSIGRHQGKFFGYQAVVRPWLWFLTRTSDCRIFQEMTVPDIVKKVFEDDPAADFKFELTGAYRKWTYCVQYRETDFNFISRLLELEGISYYLRHTDGHHTVVLTDSTSKLTAAMPESRYVMTCVVSAAVVRKSVWVRIWKSSGAPWRRRCSRRSTF